MKTERQIIHELVEALQWCSGASDFQPGALAEKGWAKLASGILPEARAYLALCKSQPAQYDSYELRQKLDAALEALARICPGRRELLLQVLMHLTAAGLEGRSNDFVESYFDKVKRMLAGEFDR